MFADYPHFSRVSYHLGMLTYAIILRIFWWLYYGWVASEVIIAVAIRTRKSSGDKVQDRGSQLILWIVIVAANTSCFVLSMHHHPDFFPSSPHDLHVFRAAAVLLFVAGLVIRWSAIFNLGRAFSANVAIRESQQLQTTGLYALVRHPSYLGMEFIFLAIGLFTANWLPLAIILIPTTAALIYRIHIEEIALRGAFGQQYVDYSAKTKRLFPGIY